MGRARKKTYKDVYLKHVELKQLKKGYSVRKMVNGFNISLHVTDRTIQRQIEQLKAKIKHLQEER